MPSLPRLRSIVATSAEKQPLPVEVGSPAPLSWSSRNIVARIINNHLHLIPYEAIVEQTSGSSELTGKVHGITHRRYWQGVSWNQSGEQLALWDGFGTLDILQTLCANQLYVLHTTSVNAPILSVDWFPSQRPVIFQPDKGIGRGPFIGPRNPVGNLGLIVVSSSGYVTVLYQNHSNQFSSLSVALPAPYTQSYSRGQVTEMSLASASITYSLKRTTFLTVSQPGQTSFTVFKLLMFLTDQEPSLKIEPVTRFDIPSPIPCSDSVISQRTYPLLGPFHILTSGRSKTNQNANWFSLYTTDLMTGAQKKPPPKSHTESLEFPVTFCNFLDSFIVIGLKNGQVQIRSQNQPETVLKSHDIAELVKLSLFSSKVASSDLGHLVHLETSANNCLVLLLTSTHHWFVLNIMSWLGKDLLPESQMVASLLVGLEQGTDLIDVVSHLSAKKNGAFDSVENIMTNQQLISSTINQVVHHWSTVHQPSPFSLQRILVLYTILHRYFPDGPGSITKFLLASRIQIARDMLCASLIGDAKKPHFDLESFTEMAPFATYALHCLVFIFRDLYIYYHTTTITDAEHIIQGPATPHLALLAHSSSARVLADVVLWLQMLHFQISQSQASIPPLVTQAVESWMRNWSALPVDPKNILKFLSALLLHLNKVQRSPSNPFLIPSTFPPWAIEHFVKLKTNLGPQFETMGEALLGFDSRWLGLSLGPPVSRKSLLPLRFPSTETDVTHSQFELKGLNGQLLGEAPKSFFNLPESKVPSASEQFGAGPNFTNDGTSLTGPPGPFMSQQENSLECLNLPNHPLIQPTLPPAHVSPSGTFPLDLTSSKRFKSDIQSSIQISNDILSQLNISNGNLATLNLPPPDNSVMNDNLSRTQMTSTNHLSRPLFPSMKPTVSSASSFPLICLRCRYQSNTPQRIDNGLQPTFIRMVWVQRACPCGGPWVADHSISHS